MARHDFSTIMKWLDNIMKWLDEMIQRSEQRSEQQRRDILQAIWDVRWDRYGATFWEISTLQLWKKLNEPYSIGKLYVRLDQLEKAGLIKSRYQKPTPDLRRTTRFIQMTPLGIARMTLPV